MKQYQCSNNPAHITNERPPDGWCAQCTWGEGFMKEVDINLAAELPGISQNGLPVSESALPRTIGLAVLLIDGSESMFIEKANRSDTRTREDRTVESLSQGIWQLSELHCDMQKDAYIMPVLFDEEVKPLFVLNVAEILQRFETAKKLEAFFRAELLQLHRRTNINLALEFARGVYNAFVRDKSLAQWGGPSNVEPMMQRVPFSDGTERQVPNFRTLLFTDGLDVVSKKINGNPFRDLDSGVDLLLGAYFGDGKDAGCSALKDILGLCPEHQRQQFFLIDSPDRIQKLRGLFRMSSRCSGFCPQCLGTQVDK